jgi:outer membrane protein TolC
MSRTNRLVIAFTALAATAVAAPAFAQKAPAKPVAASPDYDQQLNALVGIQGGLTADVAAARAAKVSPEARRRREETSSAHAQVEQAKLARLPRVDTTLRYTRLSDVTLPPGLAMFVTVPLNNYNADAQLGVPLSDYFLRFPSLIDAAKAGEDASRVAERATQVAASQDARVAYYEWVRSRLQVVVAERLVAQVGRTVDQLSALVEVQRASRADLLRLQAQKAQADLVLVQARDGAVIREEQLRILIGAEPEEQLAIGEDVRAEITIPEPGKVDDLAREALGRRLESRTLTLAEQALIRQRQAQKTDRYPHLSAFAQANYDNPNQRAFGSSDWQFTWAVGAQVTWSPNDTLLTGARIDDTDAKIRAIDADRKRLSNGVHTEIVADLQQFDIARAAIVNTRQALVAAEEGYRVRKELLDAERVTAVELVDAETSLTQARIAAIDARIDLRIAWTRLQHALGLDLQ